MLTTQKPSLWPVSPLPNFSHSKAEARPGEIPANFSLDKLHAAAQRNVARLSSVSNMGLLVVMVALIVAFVACWVGVRRWNRHARLLLERFIADADNAKQSASSVDR